MGKIFSTEKASNLIQRNVRVINALFAVVAAGVIARGGYEFGIHTTKEKLANHEAANRILSLNAKEGAGKIERALLMGQQQIARNKTACGIDTSYPFYRIADVVEPNSLLNGTADKLLPIIQRIHDKGIVMTGLSSRWSAVVGVYTPGKEDKPRVLAYDKFEAAVEALDAYLKKTGNDQSKNAVLFHHAADYGQPIQMTEIEIGLDGRPFVKNPNNDGNPVVLNFDTNPCALSR